MSGPLRPQRTDTTATRLLEVGEVLGRLRCSCCSGANVLALGRLETKLGAAAVKVATLLVAAHRAHWLLDELELEPEGVEDYAALAVALEANGVDPGAELGAG